MFPGCLEYCNAEGTLSKYSQNIARQLGYYLRPFLHSLTFELDVTITKAYDFSESVRVYPAGTRYPEISAESFLSVAMFGTSSEHLGNILKQNIF